MHSESTAKIAKALAAAQAEMSNATLNKTNPHFKSRYADLAAIRDAAIPALAKHGLAVTQLPDVTEDGFMLVTRLMHESGEWISSTYPLPTDLGKPQQMGSAQTYARRYSLAALVGISAEEDDDANAAEAGGSKETVKPKTPKAETAKPKSTPDAAAKVGQWVEAQVAFLETITSTEEYDRWREGPKVEQNMPVLQDTYPDHHKRLVAASIDASKRVAKPIAAE